MDGVTPASMRELAARARALGAEIDAAKAKARAAGDEPTRHATFRLDEAAGWARHVGDELDATSSDLARVRGRSDCGADWGACPEHGGTLAATGGKSWCTEDGCRRRWNYDRLGAPCNEPVEFLVRDAHGGGGPMCRGHAADAELRIIGAEVTPFPESK